MNESTIFDEIKCTAFITNNDSRYILFFYSTQIKWKLWAFQCALYEMGLWYGVRAHARSFLLIWVNRANEFFFLQSFYNLPLIYFFEKVVDNNSNNNDNRKNRTHMQQHVKYFFSWKDDIGCFRCFFWVCLLVCLNVSPFFFLFDSPKSKSLCVCLCMNNEPLYGYFITNIYFPHASKFIHILSFFASCTHMWYIWYIIYVYQFNW